jgi:CspA family cold shock protein
MHQGRQGGQGLMLQGVVKVYDPVTGVGVVIRDDDRSEVYLRPGSLAGSIFRTLRQGQRIVFEVGTDQTGPVATGVRIGSEGA